MRAPSPKEKSLARYERAQSEAPFGMWAITAERLGQLSSSCAISLLLGLGWLHGYIAGAALLAFVPSVAGSVCWLIARIRGEPWVLIEPRLDYGQKPPKGDVQ